jgi:hypothetical protein
MLWKNSLGYSDGDGEITRFAGPQLVYMVSYIHSHETYGRVVFYKNVAMNSSPMKLIIKFLSCDECLHVLRRSMDCTYDLSLHSVIFICNIKFGTYIPMTGLIQSTAVHWYTHSLNFKTLL